jgi:glycine cleavage system H protein
MTMSDIPSELRYTKTHEWAKLEDDGTVLIGITEHAQGLLGDMVFVELPELMEVTAEEECAVVESVKAASDVYSPINGEIVEINSLLLDDPALINTDPYGAGWLFRIKPVDEEELRDLLDADQYQQHVASEEH